MKRICLLILCIAPLTASNALANEYDDALAAKQLQQIIDADNAKAKKEAQERWDKAHPQESEGGGFLCPVLAIGFVAVVIYGALKKTN